MWQKLGVAVTGASMVATLAFFQARALSNLAAGVWAPAELAPTMAPSRPTPLADGRPAPAHKRQLVLSRNPFDSSWRPEPASPGSGGPLRAPRCGGAELAAVSESPDDAWSLASLAVPATGKPRLVRRGDTVDDRVVAHIGDNPLLASPALWLRSGDGPCQVVLRERVAADARAPAPAEPTPTGVEGIRRLGPTKHEIDRTVLHGLLARRGELAEHVRVERARDGRPGARLVRLAPGSFLALAGFVEGDLLVGVDGRDVSTPERALPVLSALRSAPRFGIDVERGGRRITLDFVVR